MGVIITSEMKTKTGQHIILRQATPLDAKAVLQLSYDVISENDTLVTTIEEFTLTEELQRDYINVYNDDPKNCMIVAEWNSHIVGLLTFQGGTLKKFAHLGTIGMIVHKNFRGIGIGKALLSTFIEWANYNPLLEKLCLEVLASNKKAIYLYESLGFVEEGRQRNQVKLGRGIYDDLIMMGMVLHYEWRL